MHGKTSPVRKKVGIVYNPEKERARAEWLKLDRWLRARHVTVVGGPKPAIAMKGSDFVIALGGDGTVLRVSRAVSAWGIPVLGVNVGRLGFLAATEVGAVYRTLTRILAGEGRVENRSMLAVSSVVGGKTHGPYLALNDCVVRSGGTGRVLVLQVMMRDRVLASYVGDGVIVSTSTGSTAYNLAANGPIVHPEVDVLILSPICPHTLAQRPLVIPPYETVTIQVHGPNPPAILSLDGQLNQSLSPGDHAEVRMGTEQVSLLMDPDRSFYQVLQSKLKWGFQEFGVNRTES